jgi:hypothetical protein
MHIPGAKISDSIRKTLRLSALTVEMFLARILQYSRYRLSISITKGVGNV